MGDPLCAMAFVPYSAGYGYPYGYPGAYGPYGPSLEEVKKIREAEEKAFKEAEDRAKELMEAEKKQYEEFVEAQKKAVDDAVAKEKEFYEKERELAIKLGTAPFAYGTQDMDMVGMVLASMAHEQAMATH